MIKFKSGRQTLSEQSMSKGFTIVELLVVIVVIGILAALTIISYTGISQRAIAASLQSDLTNASQQLKIYQVTNSAYPTSLDVNNCFVPASDNMCLKSSPGNSYSSYIVNNSSTPQTFSLDVTNGTTTYRITNDSIPVIVATIITPVDLMEYSTDAIAQAGYVSNNTSPSPAGHYKMNDNAENTVVVDSIGAIGNGALTGAGNTSGSTFAGKINSSLHLDGSNDYINIPDDPDLDFATSYSFAFWVKLDAINKVQYFYARQKAAGTNPNMFFRIGSDNKLQFYTHDGAVSSNVTTTATLAADIWYHIVGVSDTVNDKAYVYINGSESVQAANTTGAFVTDRPLIIGGEEYSASYLDGKIDDFRIYNLALTLAQVSSLYNSASGTEDKNPLLQCYSEPTIKQQGSYALKGIATITTSLNKTLTRTVSPTIDLSSQNQIQFDIRSSRTGTNLQAQIHDSGGTTSTHNINITSADTWQTETWDISGISGTDKDVIDQIIFKVINADAANTFYVDNMVSSD